MALPMWNGYFKWLSDLGVTTKKEAEELLNGFGDDKEVSECLEDLHKAEAGFRALAAKLNANLQKEEDKVWHTLQRCSSSMQGRIQDFLQVRELTITCAFAPELLSRPLS